MKTNTTPTLKTAASNPHSNGGEKKRQRWKRKMQKARRILEGGLEDVARDREALESYLRFRAHFRSYSRRNTLLIRAQRPSARFCKGYRQWQQVGRQVKRGENGIMIYVPLLRKPTEEEIEEDGRDPDERVLYGWTVGYVFDYEQTKAVSEDALRYQSPIPELDAEGGAEVYRRLIAVAEAEGLTVREEELAKEGYFSAGKRHIGIRRGMPAASKAATLAHELAHAIAHGPGASEERPESRAATRA